MSDSTTVEVWFPIKKDSDGFPKTRDWEGLFCASLDDGYEVRSVPFYIKEVAYGDIIDVVRSPGGSLRFGGVRRRGGYSVYRVYLRQNDNEAYKIIEKLLKTSSKVERDGALIAIAVLPDQQERVVDLILEGRASGRWGAQDGYIAEDDPGS